MTEFLFLGIPTVIVPQNLQEERFAKQFVEHGACVLLSRSRQSMSSWKNDILSLFNKTSKRKIMAAKAQRFIDGKGARRVAKIVSHYL